MLSLSVRLPINQTGLVPESVSIASSVNVMSWSAVVGLGCEVYACPKRFILSPALNSLEIISASLPPGVSSNISVHPVPMSGV